MSLPSWDRPRSTTGHCTTSRRGLESVYRNHNLWKSVCELLFEWGKPNFICGSLQDNQLSSASFWYPDQKNRCSCVISPKGENVWFYCLQSSHRGTFLSLFRYNCCCRDGCIQLPISAPVARLIGVIAAKWNLSNVIQCFMDEGHFQSLSEPLGIVTLTVL